MVTPFDASNGALDLDQAKRLATALLDSGTEGLVVCGTTGESPTLSNHEKLALLEATVEVAHARGATGHRRHDHLQHRREHRAVARGGAPRRRRHPGHGAVLQQPAPGRAVPALPRDCPRRRPAGACCTTSRRARRATWKPRTTLRLAREVSNIVGVKEASANFKQIGEIIRDAPEGFHVWSGNDARHPDDHGPGRLRRRVCRRAPGRQADRRVDEGVRRRRERSSGGDPSPPDAAGRRAVCDQQPDSAQVRAQPASACRLARRVCRWCRSTRSRRRSWTPRSPSTKIDLRAAVAA